MARWEVRTRKDTVQVEGANWLLAVGAALPALDLDASVLSRLVCDVQSEGVVRILDPVSRTPLLVRRMPDDISPTGARRVVPVGVVASSASPLEDDTSELDLAHDAGNTDEIDVTAPPPPSLHMPAPTDSPGAMAPDVPPLVEPAAPARPASSADPSDLPGVPSPPLVPSIVPSIAPDVPNTRATDFTADDIATLDDIEIPLELIEAAGASSPDPQPSDLAEQLFIRGMDINDAEDIEEAASATLEILKGFVPAEAGSVLYAGINDTALRFLAADGPSATEVSEITVPLGHGIAGFCFDTGAALIIRNAGQDPRHLHDVDKQTGFHTGDMLSVALRDQDGGIHGCIQLINPPRGFTEWHLDAAHTLSTTLADFIAVRA